MTGLFDPDRDLPVRTGYPKIDRQFAAFHRTHPEVFRLFQHFAREFRDHAGQDHGSAEQIIQRLRWETSINPTYKDGLDYKISNNFRRRYARLLELEDPSFVGWFRTRRAPHEPRKPD